MAKAVVTFATYQGGQLISRDSVTHDIVKVGRDPKSHLRVDDPAASRMHAVIEVASVVYRMLFVLLTSLSTIREAQTARMGHAGLRASYRSSGMLAAAVLTRSWDRARRMQDGLAGRGMETGLRVLPEVLPSSRAFVAASVAGLAGIVVASVVLP